MALTRPNITQIEHPNPVKHRIISFVKSGLRIVACYFLAYYDLQIAAIALANNLILVTHNTKEFSRIPQLQLEDWEIE
jgi:tRNA(fMet)-specific endonuclease VapC